LTNDFQISDSRIQTDGKGESMPVSKNDTPEGKAQNRRVEFVKI
jgi:outer membrane protein OmpA-like peptidoglycan-associated protein